MNPASGHRSRLPQLWAVALVLGLVPALRLEGAQIGELVSPGPLTKAHAALEGIEKCEKCHEKGKQVSTARCLSCHKPVEERIARKKGVHRDVKNDCVACHVEHAGRDAELRPFDAKKFDHAAETGFALDGRHEPLARDCTRCHRTRSFLAASPACASCHKDVHKGALGADCASCHPVAVPFQETRRRFDHAKAAFRLEGAHAAVDCAKCHPGGLFRGVKFESCESCHKDPHKRTLGANCAECHTAATWKTQRFDHARSGVPLAGRHATVPCAKCHVKPATQVKLKMTPCAACHTDVHRSLFRQDCAACHKETGFAPAPFDHAGKTRFALTGRHEKVPCAACHKRPPASGPVTARVVDFRGLKTPCAACHADVHRGQLGTACETCHGTASFKLREYRHPRLPEFFSGRHAGVACEACHTAAAGAQDVSARTFRNLPLACDSCHKDVHLGQLGAKCESCHDVALPQGAAKFAAVKFRHAAGAFPLTGKHEPLECAKCHRSEAGTFPAGKGTAVRFKGVATECRACHKDIHLGQLGPKCETCHSTKTFAVEKFQHKEAAFFKGKHGAAECRSCHKPVDGVFPAGRGKAVRFTGLGPCASCHADVHKGTLGASCASCHAVNAAFRSASRAFHKFSGFDLDGKHLGVPCASCHLKGVTKGTPNRCFDCHWIRRQDDPNRTRLGAECEQCHRTISWTAVAWDHGARTGVPLSGAHRTLACERCHTGRVFRRAGPGEPGGMACYGCHRPDYDATRTPNHATAGFPIACEACHRASDTSWRGAHFDHSRYPLVGPHQSQPCVACHRSGVYLGTPTDCYGCHKSAYDSSANPSHLLAGFQTRCDSCHRNSDASWHQGRFPHAAWPLLGVHGTQACIGCHRSGVYRGTPKDCYGCHKTDYDRSANPNHVAAGFPTACETCHKVTDPTWHQGTFNHASAFPLVGVHATQPCAACHKSGVYRGTPRDCYGCHKTAYDGSTNPNHLLAGFETRCDSCHNATDPTWKQGRYPHTAWPLLGVHGTQECLPCHRTGVYRGTSHDCYACHQTNYQQAANPNHVTAGFPTACQTCHKASDPTWHQGTFTHSSFTLVGVHATQPCAACHKNGVYAGTARDCYGCHRTSYDQSTNPNHLLAGFANRCDSCHNATDATWQQGRFPHASWPLLGVHGTQSCITCHKNGVYRGTAKDCYACHQTNYQQAANPNHVTAGFPTSCDRCHKASDPTWHQGTFTHSTFTLVGVHATQPCARCHVNGVYAGTARTCVGCHLTNYQQAANPNHVTAGFPTTCDTCHKASDPTWHQGTFTHSTFALVGVHATQPCARCHVNGGYAGTARTCVGCHLTNYQQAANPNHVTAGFPTTCETCHKASDPTWHQGTFTHSTFALVGVHATQPCARCHVNGVFSGTARTCVGCHLTNYQQAANPNHAAAGFPTTCDTCHRATDSSWNQGTFNHTWFPITTGRHAGNPCSACHTAPSNYAVFTCVSCHGRAQTDSHHSGVAGYRYDSQACYACHPQGRSN